LMKPALRLSAQKNLKTTSAQKNLKETYALSIPHLLVLAQKGPSQLINVRFFRL
jgi:hypothetical protein